MIFKTSDGNFVISTHQAWKPGVYETRRAANYAFRFRDGELQTLQDSVNPGGVITYDMLKNLARIKKERRANYDSDTGLA